MKPTLVSKKEWFQSNQLGFPLPPSSKKHTSFFALQSGAFVRLQGLLYSCFAARSFRPSIFAAGPWSCGPPGFLESQYRNFANECRGLLRRCLISERILGFSWVLQGSPDSSQLALAGIIPHRLCQLGALRTIDNFPIVIMPVENHNYLAPSDF